MLVYCVTDARQKMPRGLPVNSLITYFGMQDKQAPLSRVKEAKGWKHLFLDCGAFAADNARKTIDLTRYSEYCARNLDAIDVYVSLDVRGKMQETVANYRRMVADFGLAPTPVFPVLSGDKDEWQYLEEMLAEADYVALGNLVGRPWPKRVVEAHLDKVFAINERYKCRIHSFGYTGKWALLRYPFYSVDTARWLQETAWWRHHYVDKTRGSLKIRYLREPPETLQQVRASDGLRGGVKGKRIEQISRSARAMQEYGHFLTRVWAKRGVMWDDAAHRRCYPDLYGGEADGREDSGTGNGRGSKDAEDISA